MENLKQDVRSILEAVGNLKTFVETPARSVMLSDVLSKISSIQQKLTHVSAEMDKAESDIDEESDDEMDDQSSIQSEASSSFLVINPNTIYVPSNASLELKALGAIVNDSEKEKEFTERCVEELRLMTDKMNVISTHVKILIRRELTKNNEPFPKKLEVIDRRYAVAVDKLRHRIELRLLDDPEFVHNHFAAIYQQYYQPRSHKKK